MSRNGNILSFFRPLPSSQASPSQPSQPAPPSPGPQPGSPAPAPTSSPPLTPYLPSSPVAGPAAEARPLHLSRDAVIRGSDDEGSDDSSDDSLPDLFAAAQRRESPAAPARRDAGNPCVTPRAKRTALEFHSSPLAIIPKHKFDMKSLLSHARRDHATEASAQRLSDLNRGAAVPESGEDDDDDDVATALREHAVGGGGGADSGDEGHARFKLARALERSEAGRSRKRWHFFQQDGPEGSVLARARNRFPKEAAAGPWAFLRDAAARQGTFLSGLPLVVQGKRGDLPDEIYAWILDEICLERSGVLRDQYVDLASICPQQTRRLLDAGKVVKLFADLGSNRELEDFASSLTCTTEPTGASSGHLLGHLKSVLTLLSNVSGDMDPAAIPAAVKALLRLGIDQLVVEHTDLLSEYQLAMQSLVEAVPAGAWDDFCEDVCTCLFRSVEEASLRWQPLSCMAASTPRCHELRRRLAAVFFFDELPRSRARPGDSAGPRAAADRLDAAGAFAITGATDYLELTALVRLLDAAVDDGARGAPAAPHARAQFDAEVDALCRRLKVLLSKIDANRGMHVSRIEAKTTIEWVLDRLTHAVRSRPPPKVSILDAPRQQHEGGDPALPRQQAYMKKFFLPKKEEA